jgi:hypothetical protein
MRGAHDAEVAPVERDELVFTQTLDDREHGRIDEADPQVTIRLAKLSRPAVVGRAKILDHEPTSLDVGEETEERVDPQPLVTPVVDLDQHGSWDDAALVGVCEKIDASGVVGVPGVQQREQRSRV